MGLRSDTRRCRVLAYGVERSSYQSNVAPKGDPRLSPILGSARGVHSTPGIPTAGSNSQGVCALLLSCLRSRLTVRVSLACGLSWVEILRDALGEFVSFF